MEDKQNKYNEKTKEMIEVVEENVIKKIDAQMSDEALEDCEELENEDIIDAIGVDKMDCDDTTVSDAELIKSLKIPFKPLDNKVLVKPMPIEMIRKELSILDEKKNRNLKPGDTMFTKKVIKHVESDFRKGVILAMGKRATINLLEDADIKVGDVIVFNKRVLDYCKFDLYRDTILINQYDIDCKVEEQK